MHASPATPTFVLTGGIVARHSEMSDCARAVSSRLPETSCPSLRAQARLGVEAGAVCVSTEENGFKDWGMAQPPNANDRKIELRILLPMLRSLQFSCISTIAIDVGAYSDSCCSATRQKNEVASSHARPLVQETASYWLKLAVGRDPSLLQYELLTKGRSGSFASLAPQDFNPRCLLLLQ